MDMNNISKKTQEIEEKLEQLNAEITKEDIQNATTDELAEFVKLNLKIQKKLEAIELLKNGIKEGE